MGLRLAPNLIVDLSSEGSAVVDGKTWYWSFHEYCGPTFTDETGGPLKRQPGVRNPVWKAFEAWLPQYRERKRIVKEFETGSRQDP